MVQQCAVLVLKHRLFCLDREGEQSLRVFFTKYYIYVGEISLEDFRM